MQKFRHPGRQQKILMLLMVVGLFLQVQTAFACEMTGTTGPVEDCCCDGMKPKEEPLDLELDTCCEYSSRLSLKEAGSYKELPAAVQTQPAQQLSGPVFYLLLSTLWPEEPPATNPQISWDRSALAVSPGTKTYLSTQRLRI